MSTGTSWTVVPENVGTSKLPLMITFAAIEAFVDPKNMAAMVRASRLRDVLVTNDAASWINVFGVEDMFRLPYWN